MYTYTNTECISVNSIFAVIVISLTIVNKYLYEMLTDRIFQLWGELYMYIVYGSPTQPLPNLFYSPHTLFNS